MFGSLGSGLHGGLDRGCQRAQCDVLKEVYKGINWILCSDMTYSVAFYSCECTLRHWQVMQEPRCALP